MANNCLVTKLKAVVDNDELRKFGEFRVEIKAVTSPDATNRGFTIRYPDTGEDHVLTLKGTNAYFTDSTLTQNLGTSLTVHPAVDTDVFVSNADAVISIPDKYNIYKFDAYGSSWDRPNIIFDVDELATSPIRYFLWQGALGVYGNVDGLFNNGYIIQINLQNNIKVSGNIENWGNTITAVRITSPLVTGNIAQSPMFSSILESLLIMGCNVEGSIEALSVFPALFSWSVDKTQITGDMGLAQFYRNTALRGSVILGNGVTGSIETFAQNLYDAGNRQSAINLTTTDNMTYNGQPAKTNYGSTAHINLSGNAPVITW